MDLIVDGVAYATTDQGFLLDPSVWNERLAERMAALENIELTGQHWEIIRFIRAYYQDYRHLPNARMFTKAVAKGLGADKGNSRYLHRLFPEGPLKYACKLAGLPKPPGCL